MRTTTGFSSVVNTRHGRASFCAHGVVVTGLLSRTFAQLDASIAQAQRYRPNRFWNIAIENLTDAKALKQELIDAAYDEAAKINPRNIITEIGLGRDLQLHTRIVESEGNTMTETHVDAQDGHTMCGQQKAGNGVPADQATHQACKDVAAATDRRDGK